MATTNASLTTRLAANGSVTWNGQVYTTAGSLPSDVEIAAIEAAAEAASETIEGDSLVDDSVVGTEKIQSGSISAAELAADSVAASEIAAGAVGTSEIATSGVATAEILDGTVLVADLGAAAKLESFQHAVSSLASAGDDLAATTIFVAPTLGATLTSATIIPLESAAGIDNSNTCVVTLKDGAGNTIVAKTYNTATQPPAAGVAASLGTLDVTHKILTASETVTLTVAQGATSNIGDFMLVLEYSVTDA